MTSFGDNVKLMITSMFNTYSVKLCCIHDTTYQNKHGHQGLMCAEHCSSRDELSCVGIGHTGLLDKNS